MFSFGIPISPALQGLLEQDSPPLEQVLEDDSCIRAFKSRYHPLIEYLKTKAFDILKKALSDDVNALKAYQLFSQENDVLAGQLGDSPTELQSFATTVFAPNADIVYINRFAFITQLVILSKHTLQFDFIENFFKYLHLRSVYGIFEAIFMPSDNSPEPLQNEMAQDGFVTKLVQYLGTLSGASTPEEEGQVCSIYKLIGLMVPAEPFKFVLHSQDVISGLLVNFTSPTERILAEQWATITQLIDENTYQLIEEKVDTLIGYLTILNDKFNPHQVEAIRALANLIPLSESTRNKVVAADVATLLFKIVSQFQSFTFAQLAVIQFAKSSLPYPDIANPVLTKLLEYSASVMTAEKSQANARAFVWQLYEGLKDENSETGNAALAKVPAPAMENIQHMADLASSEYGGAVPDPIQYGEDTLGNLSPEQIMALLKFLTGGGGLA